MFRFDEVAFIADGIVTAEEISADFAHWWEYGQTERKSENGGDGARPDELYALKAVVDYNIMLGNLEDPAEEGTDVE